MWYLAEYHGMYHGTLGVYYNSIKFCRGHCEIANSSGSLVDMPTLDGL